MDKQGFIDFNTRLSPENSGKADSYARAIQVLDEVLPYQDVVDLHGQSLYQVSDTAVIEAILHLVNDEVKKMKLQQQNIFDDYGKPNQRSYPLKSFCSAALKSLKKYAQYMQDVNEADRIVAQEADPRSISTRLIDHFNLTKEGEDVVSESKRRKGQDYFRRMILTNYGGRCALTGMDIPQLLLASHIIPWAEKAHKQDRLNPCNGICLSALYDKAFDQGLITFSPDDYSVILLPYRSTKPRSTTTSISAVLPARRYRFPRTMHPNATSWLIIVTTCL
ncbi:MAG: HNH endonuclease signature motif containing protein [Prevotella sp.]|nr:HNH endonuclease signature motif containing protein [Prevotella sp.]